MAPDPKPPRKSRVVHGLGRAVEASGFAAGILGLAYAFFLTINRAGLARLMIDAQQALLGQDDAPTTATFTGLICLIPALALLQIGAALMARGKAANPGTELLRRGRWRAILLDRRPLTLGRMAAILLCVAIALIALATAASLWPRVQP